MLKFNLISLLALCLLLCGCGGVSLQTRLESYTHDPSRHTLDSVPFYPQRKQQCGPAALAMLLQWSGTPTNPDSLAPEIFTPSLKGSLQSALIAASRRHAKVAYPIRGPRALLREIAAGHPVIVLQNLGIGMFPNWHYAVVIGYDLEQDIITLHSGTTPNKQVSLDFFEYTWAKSDYWGLLVLPPTQLPATAIERDYVAAVVGLEKTRKWHSARQGYDNALKRWPGSLLALIGLSNSYYALDDLQAAEQTLREATMLHPGEGLLFNNLAQILWLRGKRDEALPAARRAVTLGGPLVETYRETLEEIERDERGVK